jgi:hypothetical protein
MAGLLVITAETRGLPFALHEIGASAGLILVLDVTSPDDRERLLAYVWPDEADRLAHVEAAIGVATADPPPLDRAEAAAWTEAALDPATAEAGVARVLMHAVALQYAPEETTSRESSHTRRGSGRPQRSGRHSLGSASRRTRSAANVEACA